MKKLLAGFGLLMATGCTQSSLPSQPVTPQFYTARHYVEASCRPDCYFLAQHGTVVNLITDDEDVARAQFISDASAFRGDWSWDPKDPHEFVPHTTTIADGWPASGDLVIDYDHPNGVNHLHLTLTTK